MASQTGSTVAGRSESSRLEKRKNLFGRFRELFDCRPGSCRSSTFTPNLSSASSLAQRSSLFPVQNIDLCIDVQAPNPDLYPRPTSPSTSPNEGAQSPPSDFDPRQKPSIVSVGFNEFLIASHTASTTLGVFVNELGEPCRGTLEWSSNLRSLGSFPSLLSPLPARPS